MRLLGFCAVAMIAMAGVPASADVVLYNNDFGGVISGDGFNEDAWGINFGFAVADSFSLAANSTVNSAKIAFWAFPGDEDEPLSVNWDILDNTGAPSDPLQGNVIASGVATPTGLPVSFFLDNDRGYSVFGDTFSLGGVNLLGGATYWLELNNGVLATGDPLYWDQSDGANSLMYDNALGYLTPTPQYPCQGPCTFSNSFELIGTTAEVPEPGGMALLTTVLLALAGLARHATTCGGIPCLIIDRYLPRRRRRAVSEPVFGGVPIGRRAGNCPHSHQY